MNYPVRLRRGIGPPKQLELLNKWLFIILFLTMILKNASSGRVCIPELNQKRTSFWVEPMLLINDPTEGVIHLPKKKVWVIDADFKKITAGVIKFLENQLKMI
jgi:hypothetical protein